jgi:tetratricopeptide (TPR) repeat protein
MLTPWCLLPTRWVLCLHSAGRRRDALHSLRPMPRLLAATTVLGALAWASTTARAAPWAPKKKAARDLINAAADAADAGDFARSAALSLDSLKVEPSIIAAWNAGEAFTAAGEWLRAIEQYDRALADPHLPKKRRPDIEARRDLARAFLDASTAADAQRWDEARAAYLEILDRDDLVPQDKQNVGTAIDQLAKRRAAAEAATAAAAAPRAKPEGYTAHGNSPRTTPATPAAKPAPIDVRTPARASRWSDTSALVILGTGAIGVGAGVWLRSHAQDLDDQADAPETPEPRAPLHDRADRFRTGATVALATGGALVLVGVVKLTIPPDAPRPTVATLQPTAGGALVVVGGRF